MAMDRLRKLSAILDDDAPDDAAMEALLSQSSIAPEVDDTLGPDAAALDASVLLPRTPTGDFACVECVVHAAELFCEQCHDYFCELCFGGQHRKGGRRTHTSQPVVAASVAAAIATTSQPMEVEQGSVNGQANNEGGEDEEEGEEEEDDDDSDDDSDSDDASEDSGAWRAPARRRSICNLMGNLFLGVFAGNLLAPTATPHHARLLTSEPSTNTSSVRAAEAQGTVLERAKSIPVRLTYEERKLLRTLEAALSVSHYTDKLDAPAFTVPAKRLRTQLQEICGFLSGIMVGLNYKQGQTMLEEKNFSDKAAVFQEIFELGRRYKIMNPEKMRGEYGKLMYIMQDAMNPEIQELLGFSCHTKIRTVYDVLEEANALGVLRDSKIETATMVVAPEGKTRTQIQRQIKLKENAIKAISSQYINSKINRDGIQQCLYSIADNNYHLYFERDPIDRMIQLLTHHFDPRTEDDGYSLAIVSGQDGARLSHSHTRQYNYVLQSLTLWREIAHDMFRLWCLTDDDLLDGAAAYTLSDTGQGLHRLQSAPRVSRAMHVILHMTQRKLENWVGSSVIHLGDKNVPNALMFIDKYTQVGHILRPIVKTVDAIDGLVAANSKLDKYITTTFGGAATLKRAILSDFFREAFDGSGADNFFEAGSCIDGRLTSAWNWCSNLPDKPFFPVFKIAGFVGFDGKFA